MKNIFSILEKIISRKGNTRPSLDRWGEIGLQALKEGIAENERKYHSNKNQQVSLFSQESSQQPMTQTPSFNPVEFPTLVKYNPQQIENAVQSLMNRHHMTRGMALVNLEMDLSEQKQKATGGE